MSFSYGFDVHRLQMVMFITSCMKHRERDSFYREPFWCCRSRYIFNFDLMMFCGLGSRGFGFVKYRYAEDAAEAMKRMNHKVIGGREITIAFAEENRKTPQEMRTTNHTR